MCGGRACGGPPAVVGMALVVVTDSDLPSTGAEERLLEAAGHSVRRADVHSEAELLDAVAGASALLVQWARIDGRVLDAGRNAV